MNRALTAFLMLAFVPTLTKPSMCAGQTQDEAEIRTIETQQAEAWNHHDAKAYATLFTEDADVVNVLGWWWKGRPQLESKLTAAYAFVFRESTLTIDEVDIKFLNPEMAIAHVRWSMTGAKSATGNASQIPQQGIQTQVLQKHAGKWLIAVFQNTNGVPEVPFHTGPPPAQPGARP
jgi:uncharacterized protein (TIGR02246 family)